MGRSPSETRYRRSIYGVGAPSGINQPTVNSPLLSYTYNETGYNSVVHCIYNQSSQWTIELELERDVGGGALPNMFLAEGPLSHADHVSPTPPWHFGVQSSIVALITGGVAITNNIAIAADLTYNALSLVQCAVDFRPTVFQIIASYDGRKITVAPHPQTADDIDSSSPSQPLGRGRLQQAALWEHTRLSQRTVGLHASELGESLSSNTRRRANVSDPNAATTGRALTAVAESFDAVLVDILLAVSSAQYMIRPSNARANTPVNVTVATLSVGKPEMIYALFVLNVIIVLVSLFMASRSC